VSPWCPLESARMRCRLGCNWGAATEARLELIGRFTTALRGFEESSDRASSRPLRSMKVLR